MPSCRVWACEGEEKERFNAIQQELAELSTQFSNHVLDATKAFSLTLDDPQDVEGLADQPLARGRPRPPARPERRTPPRRAARGASPWTTRPSCPSWRTAGGATCGNSFTAPSISRASSGDLDNAPLIARILQLRQDMAALLDLRQPSPRLSLASKMAPDVPTVEGFLEELRQASLAAAQQDLEDQRQCAAAAGGARSGGPAPLGPAVLGRAPTRASSTISAKKRCGRIFPLPRVLDGLFALARRPVRSAHRGGGRRRAGVARGRAVLPHLRRARPGNRRVLPLDPYSRPAEKRGGAWMDE